METTYDISISSPRWLVKIAYMKIMWLFFLVELFDFILPFIIEIAYT